MKTHLYLFKNMVLSVLAIIAIHSKSWSQENAFEVSESQTAEGSAQTFQDLLPGGALQVFDIQYSGYPQASGSYSGNSGIGFTSGFLLTSGKAGNAKGPNTSPGTGYNSNTPGDPDLTLLADENSLDASIMEFSFVSATGYFSINYVFASEEYPENVNIEWNDVFGIFLSGPGITGPFSNNAINIALIPGTDEPVSINTVNGTSHPEYYVANWNPVQNNAIQYDGYTVPLRAEATVTPFETYYVKIAISDAGDRVYDSGIFLEEGSLTDAIQTAVVSIKSENPGIYPNPARESFWINFPANEQAQKRVEVFDAAGRRVIDRSFTGHEIQLTNHGNLQPGLYTVRAATGEKIWYNKLVIQ
jgi:hypothetical protein